MTPQEKELLQGFLIGLTRAHAVTKDAEAQALIARAVAQQPDAAYLLVQRALLLAQAVQQANAQIAKMREQSGSFVGDERTWAQATSPTPAPAPASTLQAQAAPRTAGANSGWSGFLGNAAATAAGIAGGAFLFRGLEDLFGHHDDGFSGASVPTEAVENVTINNYAGDDYANDDASPKSFADDDADGNADIDDQDDSNDDSSWV